MLHCADNRIAISGRLVLDTASVHLREGRVMLESLAANQVAEFDLSGLAQMDSAALSVVFAWMRHARERGVSMSLVNPPQQLLSLAEVYGVSDLLPLA